MAVGAEYREIREAHENDTAVELDLERALEVTRANIDLAVADGIVSPQERATVQRCIEIVQRLAAKSLNMNRQINARYCALGSEKARAQLIILPFPERDGKEGEAA